VLLGLRPVNGKSGHQAKHHETVRIAGKHAAVVKEALAILTKRFATDDKAAGYRKDGPVAVARFELGESEDAEQREARQLRQRQVTDVIEQLVKKIG
jgi:hypothetical protein